MIRKMNLLFLFIFICFQGIAMANSSNSSIVTRYTNARFIRNHTIDTEDLWVSEGKIIEPTDKADQEIDLHGLLVAPGFIDLQINGGFGFDFSIHENCIGEVAGKLPQYGVTAFLPTLVSSSKEQYTKMIPGLQPTQGGASGASVLGIHLEGPFFSPKQIGAHQTVNIISTSTDSIRDVYGSMAGVRIVTLAPEIPGALNLIRQLDDLGIVVSMGHSMAKYLEGMIAVDQGAKMITHLFNAMTPFHHREPGIIGIALTNKDIHYSVIVDKVHVHPAAISMAWRANPEGFFLVTDAMEALGLPPGIYKLGNMEVEVEGASVFVKGTKTLAGSVLSMDAAIRNFRECTGCSIVEAIEAATVKPAKILGIEMNKGTLEVGSDADFVVLDDQLFVESCYINGECAYDKQEEMVDSGPSTIFKGR